MERLALKLGGIRFILQSLVPTDFIFETTPAAEIVPVLRSAANSTGCTLIELDQDDPVGERGRQERGDETSVHSEEATSRDP